MIINMLTQDQASSNQFSEGSLNIRIVCSKIFMLHVWTIFNKNTHTCERSAIEIDERENLHDIFIYTSSFFTQKNSKDRKPISYRDL